jgi:hypothetical protein
LFKYVVLGGIIGCLIFSAYVILRNSNSIGKNNI